MGPDTENVCARGVSVKQIVRSYPSVKPHVSSSQKNRLHQTILLSTQSISFGSEIRKMIYHCPAYLGA